MTDTNHLNDSAKAMLSLPNDKRIERIRGERWIGYTRAQQILIKLEDLISHPKTHRMPNLLIVGETNAGKTMIANRFVQLHPPIDNPTGDGIIVPAFVVQAPPGPDENRFYNGILELLNSPYRPHDHISKKQFQVLRLLKHIRLRMLIIDEIHNILTGVVNRQRHFLNVIKYMGNDLQIPIVGLGTKDAVRAIQTDPQLANRFEPAPLPIWHMDREFLMLLASFERMLPLKKPSTLIEASIARKLLSLCEGSLGELSSVLKAATIYAIRTGNEQINEQVLAAIDWTPPSNRKHRAEALI